MATPEAEKNTGTRRAATRATLTSVAARAGVSPQTVSNVLNAPHLVRAETAERVRRAVRDLGYRPSPAARQLRTRRSQVLGLRVKPSPDDGVFDRFLHALTDAAARLDYRVMLYTAPDDDAEISAYADLHDRWNVDGFVLTSTHPGDRRTAHLAARGIACVTFGRPWDRSGHHPWVDVDGAAGTFAATADLIARGHRHIGFLGWPEGPGVGDDRHSGWAAAMRSAGLEARRLARAENNPQAGRAAAAALLDRGDITAVVCVSDLVALGLVAEMGARNLRMGEDLSVVGFDDTDTARAIGLSSVDQPLAEVAAECLRLITAVLASPAATGEAEQVLLAPTLVSRISSRPPPPGRPDAPRP